MTLRGTNAFIITILPNLIIMLPLVINILPTGVVFPSYAWSMNKGVKMQQK